MDGMNVAAGTTGLVLVFVLGMVGIIGAVCSIVGLVRGVSNRNTTAIALGGIGVGCAVLGIFVFRFVFWIAGLICGAMACQLSEQPRELSFEEYKQQKAMLEDPEYAEYMRNVHGVEDVSGMTLEQKFDRDAAANPAPVDSEAQFARLSLKAKHGTLTPAEQQMYNDYVRASMQKRGGEVKQPMSGGNVFAIVLVVLALSAVCIFALCTYGSSTVAPHTPAYTIEDLGNGTILFLSEHL